MERYFFIYLKTRTGTRNVFEHETYSRVAVTVHFASGAGQLLGSSVAACQQGDVRGAALLLVPLSEAFLKQAKSKVGGVGFNAPTTACMALGGCVRRS
jgi:hypothetical protein